MKETFLTLTLGHPTIPLAVAISVLLCYVGYLHYKLSRFTRGGTASSLEATILACLESVKSIEDRNELISKHALSLESRLSHSLRNAQTVRFKAVEQGGSNQSFSVALLNEKGNGVVLTTLHVRDRISTFAKPIEKYKSTHELTEEELEVIEKSKTEHKDTR